MTRNRIADEVASASDQSPPSSHSSDPNQSPALQLKQSLRSRLSRVAQVQNAFIYLAQLKGWPWLIVLLLSWLTGVTAFQRLSSLPGVTQCKGSLTALTESEQLSCAEKTARIRDEKSLTAALELTREFGEDHPLHSRASRLSEQWSQSILTLAEQKLDQGDLQGAVALANKVPTSSPVYAEVQETTQQWQQSWKRGEQLFKQIRVDLKEQDWSLALIETKVRELAQLDDYWQKRAEKLLADINLEEQTLRELDRAKAQAASDKPDDLAAAIQVASKINPKRLAWEKGQKEIGQWSQRLLELAQAFQAEGRYDEAIAAAQKIPPGARLDKQATSVIQLSQAQAVAKEGDFWSYAQAWAIANQAESGVSGADGGQVDQWRKEVQNRGQLQLAQWFATIDHMGAYQLAIDHAAIVAPDDPQRLEAQTFIAQWQKQIDNFEDHQHLVLARQFAALAKPQALRAAITEASKVKLGQPLRNEAQTLIAEWEGGIERIEDQPILDKARALAKQGQLSAAIETARQIQSERSLYPEAQSNIDQWVADIQIAEDGPILSDARSLASAGRYAEAISRAAQIGFGRALYYEAQDLIAQWRAQINQIEAAPPPPQTDRFEEPSPNDEEPIEPEPEPPPQNQEPLPEPEPSPDPPVDGGEAEILEPEPNDF